MLPPVLANLRIPVVASPMFIVSGPELVIAQCKAGIVGSFPALNAREKDGEPALLDLWLTRIAEELDRHNQTHPDRPAAPFAVNQIVHRSNTRLERDIEICHRHKVPIWITSLGARPEVFRKSRIKRFNHQRTLPGPADSGYGCHDSGGKSDVDPFQISMSHAE